jgi:hypothetical protein
MTDRKAALCFYIALDTTKTVAAARKVLDDGDVDHIRQAAIRSNSAISPASGNT